MPVRASEVNTTDAFKADMKTLRQKYPEIDAAFNELRDTLLLGYNVPLMPVDLPSNVFAQKMDYPPMGSLGLGRFIVTFHHVMDEKGHAANPMTNPLRIFTFLTVSERP